MALDLSSSLSAKTAEVNVGTHLRLDASISGSGFLGTAWVVATIHFLQLDEVVYQSSFSFGGPDSFNLLESVPSQPLLTAKSNNEWIQNGTHNKAEPFTLYKRGLLDGIFICPSTTEDDDMPGSCSLVCSPLLI